MYKNLLDIKQEGPKMISPWLFVREEKNLEDNPECQTPA